MMIARAAPFPMVAYHSRHCEVHAVQWFDEAAVQEEFAWRRWRKWLVVVALGSAMCAGLPSFIIGSVLGYVNGQVEIGDQDVAAVRAILDSDPQRFGRVRINRGPLTKFVVEGNVATDADRELLRERVSRALGEPHAEWIVHVNVEQSS